MASCKSCGAQIQWAKSQSTGKQLPMDLGSKEMRLAVIGFDDLEGTHVVRYVPTFISHFATCPDAERHRKPKNAD